MVGVEGGVSGKADSRVIECVQFSESALTCSSIDGVTEIKCGENGHFDESEFDRGSEGVTMSVKETKFGPNFGL